jgi:hypothetical protein
MKEEVMVGGRELLEAEISIGGEFEERMQKEGVEYGCWEFNGRYLYLYQLADQKDN